MADGHTAFRQIFHTERVAESFGEFLELENLFGVWFFVHAMKRCDATFLQIVRHGFIGSEHKFFDQAMSDVALAADDAEHTAFGVKFDDRLGKIEINGAASDSATIQQE